MTGRGLGRNEPPDRKHIENYPLSALAPEAQPTNHPVTVGTNWYTDFDNPVRGKDGKYRIPETITGTVRGGHCYCLEPSSPSDTPHFYEFYDQGQEGACEGFGHARALSILTGRTFNAFWVYDDARREEGTFPEGEGSTNRAACDALRKWGAHYQDGFHCERVPWGPLAPGLMVRSYRWATSVDEILRTLGITGEEIPFLNSWGHDYPEIVYMPASILERLLNEGGEADVLLLK